MPSVSCSRGIMVAVHVAWMGLQRASEHEVLEASCVVYAACEALPGCLGEAGQ